MSVAYFKGKSLTGPMGPQGPDGNPLGTLISYLGNKPPVGYLVCDGKEYQIADYSQLADFFEKEFGSKNHFGGDGTSTFAVPDFRNLFLRGFHGESEEKLSGEIGVKQEATEINNVYGKPNNICVPLNSSVDVTSLPMADTTKEFGTLNYTNCSSAESQGRSLSFTSRPVNAAVLYCIKATKSFEENPPQGDISVGVFYNSKTARVVVPASGWSANAPFTNTVAVADVIANADTQNIMVTPIEQHLNLQAKFGVIATSQGKASLTFTAVTKPDVDIIYYVFVVGSEPVQDDIVVWSPTTLNSTSAPPYYVVSKGVSSALAIRLFDDKLDTALTISNFGDVDAFYIRVNKLTDDTSAFVPWTIYGVEFVCHKSINYNNLLESITLYGTFNNVENVSKIATFYASDVVPTVTGNVYRYRFFLETPVKYPSYVFSAFNSVGAVDQGITISDIYFLRSKADIIEEGGTV